MAKSMQAENETFFKTVLWNSRVLQKQRYNMNANYEKAK